MEIGRLTVYQFIRLTPQSTNFSKFLSGKQNDTTFYILVKIIIQ